MCAWNSDQSGVCAIEKVSLVEFRITSNKPPDVEFDTVNFLIEIRENACVVHGKLKDRIVTC